MKYLIKNSFRNVSLINIGTFCFLSGTFFLPSSLIIGLSLLLIASILGSFLCKKSYFKDPWNYSFIIFGVIILLSGLLHNFYITNNYVGYWDPSLSIVGMGNWIPFIWLFWAIQPYLYTNSSRRLFGLILISGTFPVLISGFGQFFLNWTGPFQTLNGLIVWYQRPIEQPGGLTGLFNHQNYAGSWLVFVWPFCLALFLEKRDNIFRKLVAISFLFSVGFAAFLTYSRNAWVGLITTIPIVIGKKIYYFIPFLTLIILILIYVITPISSNEIQNFLRDLIPERILLEFTKEGYIGLDATRKDIYMSALNLIKNNPIIGTGASSFSAIFHLETNFWKGHSHNILLELAVSYGLPAMIIFLITITFLLILSGKAIFLNSRVYKISLYDRAFWASLFFFSISQLVDIQYFDGKISVITWILIAGLKNIIVENNNTINS